MTGDSVKVAVRVRPFNQREKAANSKCVISMSGNTTTITNAENSRSHSFTFDHSYWSHDGYTENKDGIYQANSQIYADQRKVFGDLGQGILDNAWQGYNATLFAYGQTGSGKSYSMIGYGPNKGIVPISCEELFKVIDTNQDKTKEFQVSYSMLEIYNEQVRDLLTKSMKKGSNLRVRQNPKSGFYVEGLKAVPVRSYSEIESLMDEGTINRTTASTNMNATSSRSHMVISIKFKQIYRNESGESTTKSSEINLVDLAGSERANATGATGDRLKEGSAINQSLSTLGNVISSLADISMGKKKVIIPYRDSVLTKLLQSALGGNSRTIMIAALSPANINYEETLSSLRYADRAKKIQNKATVNESPTDRLIRELKEENAKLVALLSFGKNTDSLELEDMLKDNERKMKEMQTSWGQRLEDARRDWEAQFNSKTYAEKKEYPLIQNINEDHQLSGIIKHTLYQGETVLGKLGKSANGRKIEFKGLGIQASHAVLNNNGIQVSIEPLDGAKTIVNGHVLTSKTQLNHLDRIVLGSNNIYLFIGFPHEHGEEHELEHKINEYDYDYCQSELAETVGFGTANFLANEESGMNVSDLRVYQEYIRILPMISEVNAISEELNKSLVFEPYIKNLASHDAIGRSKAKEIEVTMTNTQTKQVWVWKKAKFINRKFIIEELYQKFIQSEKMVLEIKQENDPFWDPVEDIFLGSAHLWLQSLAYALGAEDQLEVQNYQGQNEGLVQIELKPCNPSGKVLGDDAMVIDPKELIGKRMDFMLSIPHCLGVNWIKTNNTRGVNCQFYFFDVVDKFKSKVVHGTSNPLIGFKKQFTVNPVNKEFVQYLQTHAIVLELWGTQVGQDELNVVIDSNNSDSSSYASNSLKQSIEAGSKLSSASSLSDVEDVSSTDRISLLNRLRQLEYKIEMLKQENQSIKSDNFSLKQKIERIKNGSKGQRRSSLTNKSQLTRNNSEVILDTEIARALKQFFKDIQPVQQIAKELKEKEKECDPDDGIQVEEELPAKYHNQVSQLDKHLSTCVNNLKHSITTIIKEKKKEANLVKY